MTYPGASRTWHVDLLECWMRYRLGVAHAGHPGLRYNPPPRVGTWRDSACRGRLSKLKHHMNTHFARGYTSNAQGPNFGRDARWRPGANEERTNCRIGTQVQICPPSYQAPRLYKPAALERWDPHQSSIPLSLKPTTTITLHSISILDMQPSALLVALFALRE